MTFPVLPSRCRTGSPLSNTNPSVLRRARLCLAVSAEADAAVQAFQCACTCGGLLWTASGRSQLLLRVCTEFVVLVPSSRWPACILTYGTAFPVAAMIVFDFIEFCIGCFVTSHTLYLLFLTTPTALHDEVLNRELTITSLSDVRIVQLQGATLHGRHARVT